MHTISLQELSFPADHQDPNHPHFPNDLEHQSESRQQWFIKERILVVCGIITTIFLIVAAVIWGVAHTRDNNPAIETVLAATSFVAAPVEIQTVYESATTIVHVTTHVPLLVPPLLATSTIIPSASPALSTALSVAQSAAPWGGVPSGVCLFSGAWALKE